MSLKVERGRTLARSQALQLLFQAEILGRTVDDVLAGDYLLARASEEASPLVPYAAELARGCYAHIGEIDRGLARVRRTGLLTVCPARTAICCALPSTSCGSRQSASMMRGDQRGRRDC